MMEHLGAALPFVVVIRYVLLAALITLQPGELEVLPWSMWVTGIIPVRAGWDYLPPLQSENAPPSMLLQFPAPLA
jgi:hypothetical protein